MFEIANGEGRGYRKKWYINFFKFSNVIKTNIIFDMRKKNRTNFLLSCGKVISCNRYI